MNQASVTEAAVLECLSLVADPEIPVINIVELGIVRGVEILPHEVTVRITPTYSGCPALQAIESEIMLQLRQAGILHVRIETVLSPPWTTDWMTEEAKAKLKEYGIAPPLGERSSSIVPFSKLSKNVPCPRCDSLHTSCTSEFGATACKALYVCDDCKEPFEFFKDF